MSKKLTLLVLILCTAIPSLFAQVEVDGIRYVTNSSTKTAYVTCNGSIGSSYTPPTANTDYYVGDIVIPETIEVDGLSFTVTSIGMNAFNTCTKLTSVSLPSTISCIDAYAFRYCSSLQSIGDITNVTNISIYAFYHCSSLLSIGDLPLLKSIGDYAFYGCNSLQSIGEMPTLWLIGSSAFYDCDSLQSIGNMQSLTTIREMAFYNTGIKDLFLPETLQKIECSSYKSTFTCPTILHFSSAIPPAFAMKSLETTIIVPTGCGNVYAEALPDMPRTQILEEGIETCYDVKVSALDSSSDVLNKVNQNSSKDIANYVLDLRVHGTINSYDIMVMRNKMVNLKTLDLSDATIVANSYEYYTGYHTYDNIVGDYMFSNMKLIQLILPRNIVEIKHYAFDICSYLTEISIPEGVTKIGNLGFRNCASLAKITLPQSLVSLGNEIFQGCNALSEITIPPLVETIPPYCFWNCSLLSSVSLPPTLKSIANDAFSGCSKLTEIRIPAGVTSIGNKAIPSSVKDVYTYTIQPTNIGQNTFNSSTYLTATLHVPETSEQLYYWDTQWSQFQSITNFNEPYTYFYLDDKDLVENPDTPRIDGETDEETGEKRNPDADLGQGSGLVVEGDNSQDLGNVDIEHDGNGNGTSIIGGDSSTTESGGNINIDMLNIKINVEANKWYFFSFPFDIKCEDIKFNGQMVWRYYDGEWRAMNGSGAWKDMKDEYLKRGIGYIFQGSKQGTLTLSIPNASFDAQDWQQTLTQNVSEMAEDASWNFIGNPFQSYYELADLGFDGPITWWNPNTKSYEAYSPLDDDMSLYPFMAFFVQKPEGVDSVGFESEYQETNNQKNEKANRIAARRRREARRSKVSTSDRQLINLTVTDGETADRTRIVFNNDASLDYEVGVDASKFMSGDAPQIYSLNASNVRFAINERPADDGNVKLGFYAPESAVYTIECTHNDCAVTLTDLRTRKSIELTEGAKYQFTADQGYDDNRFVISYAGSMTSIEEAADAANAKYFEINGLQTDESHRGMTIEVKGNDVKKVIK